MAFTGVRRDVQPKAGAGTNRGQPFYRTAFFRESSRMDVQHLTHIPWSSREVEWSGKKTHVHLKLRATKSSLHVVVVRDLVRAWHCALEQAELEADAKRFNSGVDHSVEFTLDLLQHLLRNTKHSHHRHVVERVKYDDDDDDDDDEGMEHGGKDIGLSHFLLKSEMKIGEVYRFHWTFRLLPIGSPMEQSAYIRDQLVLPITGVARQLALPTASAFDRRMAQETLDDRGYRRTCAEFVLPKSLEILHAEQTRKLFPKVVEPIDHEELLGVKLRTKKKKSAEELDAEFAALEAKHDGGPPAALDGAADPVGMSSSSGVDSGVDLAMNDALPSAFGASSEPPPDASGEPTSAPSKPKKKKKRKKFV